MSVARHWFRRLATQIPTGKLDFRVAVIGTNWNARCYSRQRRRQSDRDDGSISENVLIRSMVSIIQKTDKWDALLKDLCVASESEITPPIAVQVLKRIRKPRVAFEFFEWLDRHEGFEHDGLTYSAILKVITKECNPLNAASAHSLLRKKIELGFDVSPADYDYVLYQLARVGKSETGLQLLDEMRACEFTPSITSCSLLLKELLDSKNEDSGWELFYQVLGRKVDVLHTETFNVAMKFLCVKGKWEQAMELFSVMKDEDCIPDLDTFNILIKGCSEKGELKVIRDLFMYMISIKVKPDSYTMNLLIKELCKQGRPECGNDLFNYLRRVGWLDRKFVYAQLVESLCERGWWLKGLKIFVKMVRKGHHPTAKLYYDLIRRLCMGGRLSEAYKLKELILRKGYLQEYKIYYGLIDGLCMIGRMEMVDKLLKELYEMGVEPNLRICNSILSGYSMTKNVKAVLQWVEKIKEKGWKPNAEACDSLIAHLSAEGRVNEASLVKNAIQDVLSSSTQHDGG